MEFGPPAAGDVEAKIEELKAAIYSLVDVLQRQAALAAPDKLAKLDKLDKIDDLVRVLEILAGQSEEASAALKNLAPSLARMQQVFEVNQKQIAELGGRIEGMRESLSWTARQSSDFAALTKQVGERLQALPTSEQLSAVAKRVENVAGKDDLVLLTGKLDKVAESYGWVAREMSSTNEAVQELSKKVDATLGIPAEIDERLAGVDKRLAESAAKFDARMTESIEASKAAVRGISSELRESTAAVARDLKENTAAAMQELKESTAAAVQELGKRVEALPTSEQLAEAFSQVGRGLDDFNERLDGVVRTSEEVAKTVGNAVKTMDDSLFNIRESTAKAGEQTMLVNDAVAAMSAKVEGGLKDVSANLNAVVSQAEAVRKQNDVLVDALSVVQRELSRSITVLEALPTEIQTSVASSLTALEGRFGALQDGIAKVGEASSKSAGDFASGLAEASKRLDALAGLVEKRVGELTAKTSEVGAGVSELSKSLEGMQAFQKTANKGLSDKIEEVKSASVREIAASLEAQRKQGDVQIEALVALSKKMDSAVASLKSAVEERIEEAALKAVDRERFEGVASQVSALNNAAGALAEALEATAGKTAAKLEEAVAVVREEFEKTRKQNDLIVELLSTLAREASEAKKASQEVKARLESGLFEAEVERKLLTHLSERLTPK